ncbi:MAG: TlpA family protein disulfide reductase [Armatimonadota bacterium]
MKVSIAIMVATLVIAALQASVDAGQSSKQGKPSGKTQKTTPTSNGSVVKTSKKPAQKVSPSSAANGQTHRPNEKLVARETLIGAGDVLPAYSVVKSADGGPVDISTLVVGQAVVVVYHPGSKPAMRALPQIAAAAAKAKPGIKVYALCVRTDDAGWKVSLKGLPNTMTALWDPAGRTETGLNARKVLGCDAYPTLIVTGSDGKVRDAFAGWFSGDRRLAPLLSD